jgi:hypothetical protein
VDGPRVRIRLPPAVSPVRKAGRQKTKGQARRTAVLFKVGPEVRIPVRPAANQQRTERGGLQDREQRGTFGVEVRMVTFSGFG